jgi:hypothetical protein
MGINFGKFVHTETGKYIMSILLGFGLASLFRTMCREKNCVVFHAPPLADFQNKIYRDGNYCYKFVPSATKCDKSKKIVQFSNTLETM